MDYELEINALKDRVTALEGGAAPVYEPLEISAIPGPEVGQVEVQWAWDSDRLPQSFEVGRDGKDNTGYGPWSILEGPTTYKRIFRNLIAGQTYTFTVDAVYADDQEESVSTTCKPKEAVPVPIPPRTAGRRSGLPIDVTLFKGGATNVASMDNNVLGIKFDGGLSFATRGQGWNPKLQDWIINDILAVQKAGGIFILSMPHSMTPDADMNRKGANNDYKAEQIALAAYFRSRGVDPKLLIIRLCWEFNGGWYWWTIAAPGGAEALKGACKNFMDNWRAGGMDGTLFDCCANMPSSASTASWRDLWLGPGYWNIFSIDQYDAFPPVRSAADWEKKMVPVQSVRRCAQEAIAFGVRWAIAECGNWHGPDGAGDNPTYWRFMATEVMAYRSSNAYWNIYDEQGAPANLFHDWAHNPKSAEMVRAIFGTWR